MSSFQWQMVRTFRLNTGNSVVLGLILIMSFLCLYPTLMLIRGSMSDSPIGIGGSLSSQNFAQVISNPETYRLLLVSVLFSAISTFLSISLGAVLAWITMRTNTPFRRYFNLLIFLPYIIPGSLTAVAWIFLLSPRTGLINMFLMKLLGLSEAPFNIFSFPGMVFVTVLESIPLTYTFLSAAFISMDASLEESSRMSGAGVIGTLTRVTFPLMIPAILSTALLIFILGLEAFDVPAFIGIPANIYVLTSEIFRLTSISLPPRHGTAAVYGVILLGLALALAYFYQRVTRVKEKYTTITGKGYRPVPFELGKWRYGTLSFIILVLVVSIGLPLGILLLVSLLPVYRGLSSGMLENVNLANYFHIFTNSTSLRALRNSLFLAIVGASATMFMAFIVGYITIRTRIFGRGIIDFLTFLPLCFPGIVLAVGILWAYISFPVPIYGTIWILFIAYITKFLPYGQRLMSGNLIQVGKELEESSRSSGASFLRTMFSIVLPLVRYGFLAGWSLLFISLLRQFSMSMLLWSPGSEVAAILFWDYFQNGQLGRLAALGIILLLIPIPVLLISKKITGNEAVLA